MSGARKVVVLLLVTWFAATLSAHAERVTVSPNDVEVANWEGWGCSISWWGVYSSSWSDARRKEVCRRLFSTDADALGLNIARYNAGGTSPSADSTPFRVGGKTLLTLYQDGSFHPENDAGQIACLRLAKQYGANLFEFFINSPPYWMLNNGNTRGGDGGNENLNWDYHKAFTDWMVQNAIKVQDAAGIKFNYLEPFNEPSAWWWNGTGNQEGCRITWGAQARILKNLKDSINASGKPFQITCSDENGSQEAYNTLNWMVAPDNGNWSGGGLDKSILQKVNVHAYNGWDWQERVRGAVDSNRIPKLWMSEVTYREWGDAGFVPYEMRCALPVSRSIVSDIKHLRCSAWVYWQPVEPLEYNVWYNYTYGLLPTCATTGIRWNGKDYTPGESVAAKSFYAMRQYSAFLRPGFRLVRSGDDWTLVGISPGQTQAVIVVHNDTPNPKRYSFDFSQLRQPSRTIQAWRTKAPDAGGDYNCRPLRPLVTTGTVLYDIVPANSVTTYLIPCRPYQNRELLRRSTKP